MSFDTKDNFLIRPLIFIIALGILIGSGSLYRFIYSYDMIMAFTILVMSAVIFIQIFIPLSNSNIKNYSFNASALILLAFFMFFPTMSDVVNQVKSYDISYFYIVFILISFLLGVEFRNKIFSSYLLIIVLLSFISLFYFFTELFFEVPDFVPYYGIPKKTFWDFYYFWSKPAIPMVLVRNQSIFWEPGAFGFHLIIATLLAYKDNKKLYISILLIASITTLSTTVFLFLVLLMIYHLFFGKNKIEFLGVVIVFTVIIFTSIWLILGNFELPRYLFSIIIDKFNPSSGAYASFEQRNHYVFESLKLFLDNIIIGAGHYATNFELENVRSETSALAGLMAELGLFGVVCILLYGRFFQFFKLLALPIALLWLNGEFLQYSPIAIFILAHSLEDFSHKFLPSTSQSTIELAE